MKKIVLPISILMSAAAFSQQKPKDSTAEKSIDEVVIVASSRTEQEKSIYSADTETPLCNDGLEGIWNLENRG